MQKFINFLISTFNNRKTLFLICASIFIVGVILGCVLTLSEDFICFYKDFLVGYFEKLFNKKGVFSFLIKRILTCSLILTLIFLLSLNKVTFYVIFFILFYRAFILGLALKLFLSNLLLNGAFIFLFLVFINAVCFSLAIIFYILSSFKKFEKINKCNINYLLNKLLFSIIIAILGCIIEFIFLALIIRPLNFYF